MRSIFPVAIATTCLAFVNPFATRQGIKAATPARDVVVEIKLISPYLPQSPTVSPQQPQTATPPDRFPSFNSEQFDRQFQRYIDYLERNGVPDVLILGSSRALQGVDPATLQKSLEQQGYLGLRVFNFGINGATAQVVDWVLHHVLSPDQLPRLLVWADGSRALNNGRTDHTFNKLLASAGNRQLMSGKRPIATIPTSLKLGQVCMDLLPVQLSPQAMPLRPTRPHQLPVPSSQQSVPVQCKQPIKLVFRHKASDSSPDVSNLLESLGFQPISSQFNPTQYFQRYPRVPGSYDADYRNFALTGNQAKALANISRFANTHQIPLVFVNLPLTSTYLDSTRSNREGQFREQMQRFAKTKRFTFIDLSSMYSLTRNSYFADPSHLNQFGAIAVAKELGKELVRLQRPLLSQRYSQTQ